MADTANWTEGKTFNDGTCRTYCKKISSGPPWHLRVTRHGPEDGTFTDFWNVLGSNHAENELHGPAMARYIPELSKATMMQAIEPGVMEVWSLHYALSSPFSPRTFTVLMVTHLEAVSPRQGWIISIPFDPRSDEGLLSLEERGIRGRFAAVERLRELEDGTVEWRVATTTTIGGFVPDWVTSRAVPKAIAEDVLQFLAWMRQKRDKPAGSTANAVATTSKNA
ncbi:hypothetical protein FRC04_005048 [Tulasnella sp. 424]|nr:hypothetical protein FRC04_005048 [Tulasnella sp. 424]KAG8963289.1 hypothetical protein FRC05_004805 [Tulasnella sp. 425]